MAAQVAEAKRQEAEAERRRVVDGRWDAALRQPVLSVTAVIYVRQTTSLLVFEEALRSVNFTFVTNSSTSDETVKRSLTFGILRDKEDAGQRIRLAPRTSGECVNYGPPSTLLRNIRLGRQKAAPSASEPEYVVLGLPDKKNPKKLKIVAKTMTVEGWNYAAAPHLIWTSREAPTCGIEAELPWKNTGLLSEIATLGDLAKLSHLAVQLPIRWRGVTLDVLELRLRTSNGDMHNVDLRKLTYIDHGNGLTMFGRMNGYDILESCKANLDRYVKDEYRRKTRAGG
jgi:hypothetical protein